MRRCLRRNLTRASHRPDGIAIAKPTAGGRPMTRSALLLCFVLAAGGGLAQDVFNSPAPVGAVPTFVNAEIVRVDPVLRTITFRSESGDTALTAEGNALAGLAGWHPGD